MTTDDDDEWLGVSALTPIRPEYPFGEPGAPIELYSGPIAVDFIGRWEGRIFADLAGDLQVRWSATAPEGWVDATDVNLTVEPPDAEPTTVSARRNWSQRDSEYVRASGEIMNANVGGPDALCDRVIVHFTNLPRMSPAEYLVEDGHYWAGRWTCSGAGWRLVLDVRQDHSKVWNALRESLVFVVTHVGELRRADGSSFRASEATDALTAFQTGFSFALARWVAPVAPVGFDGDNRVWEQWASWRCGPAFGYLPWWDNADGEDLKAFMELRAQQMRPTAHANRVIDGPEVLMWLRNRLVHPKDAGEPYRIEDLVTEAWRRLSTASFCCCTGSVTKGSTYRERTRASG